MTTGALTILHPVTDLEKAKAVFTALLGTGPAWDAPYYVGYEVAGQHIGLVPNGAETGLTVATAFWHVDDLDERLAALTGAGAEIVQEPTDVGGRRVAKVRDADGNVLGLSQA